MFSRFIRLAMFAVAISPALSLSAHGQTAAAVAASVRIGAVGNASRVQLAHHVPVYADMTKLSSQPLASNATLGQLTIMLSRAPQVQAAFDQLSADQVNPASPRYHQWLTPAQVGELYGPAQSDVDAVVAWLKSEGLTVVDVAPNRLFINFTGPVSVVARAFSTEFRTFALANGESRYSLITEPSVPSGIAPVIGGLVGFSQAVHHPSLRLSALGRAGARLSSDGHTPDYSVSSTTSEHFVVAGDFSTQYDMGSVYNSGYNGSGQKIAVVGQSRVDTKDISTLQALQGQTTKSPNVIIPTTGVDPGYTGGTNLCPAATLEAGKCPYDDTQAEATLDVQRTLGQAPGATVDLVVSANTASGNNITVAQDGLYIAMNYEINTLLDPIMSISFGGCENLNGSQLTNYEDSMFQTAASEGISVFVSSGDSGATSCNAFYDSIAAAGKQVLSINDFCASSHVTCIGGTEWIDENAISTYWSTKNASDGSSLQTHIPEGAWNDFYDSDDKIYEDAASGGGVSVYIPKPSYQSSVTTFPTSAAFRWVPDLSFNSSNANDFYLFCYEYAGYGCVSGSYIGGIGGTSAAAPSMAAIQAIVNQKLASAQGAINTQLYALGVAALNGFYDTSVATSGVTSCTATVASLCNNSTPASTNTATAAVAGYVLANGWDPVTGWGSLDVANYLNLLAPATNPSFSLSANSASLRFASGATTGNTSTITLIPVSGFTTAVDLTCAVNSTSAVYQPTCSIAPTSVSLASPTAVLTISSHVAVTQSVKVTTAGFSGWSFAALLLAMLGLFASLRSRRSLSALRILPLLALLGIAAATLSGCGGGANQRVSTPTAQTTGSSAGTYVVTVTGTSSANSSLIATTTVSVTIN